MAILRLERLDRGEPDPIEVAMQEDNLPREMDIEADDAWDNATQLEGQGYQGPRGQFDYWGNS